MLTQDFSRDIYQEVKKLSDGSLLLLVASQEFIAKDKKLVLDEKDINNKILLSAEEVFNDILNKVNSNTYPSDKIYTNKEGIKIIMLSVSDTGLQNIADYLKEKGIYTN